MLKPSKKPAATAPSKSPSTQKKPTKSAIAKAVIAAENKSKKTTQPTKILSKKTSAELEYQRIQDELEQASYLGNANIKPAGVKINFTPAQVVEYTKCANGVDGCIYFIEKYFKIVTLDEGLTPIHLHPFQREMVQMIIENRFSIYRWARQCGKSTVVSAVLCWFVIFNPEFSIAILANKESNAKNCLTRLKLGYEHVPKWLQQGVVEWNKNSILLENGSKVIAAATASSAARGGTYNVVYMDELAFVPFNIQEEFFTSVYPTISSGKDTKIIITSTPKGYEMFYKIFTESEKKKNSFVNQTVYWFDVPGRDAAWREEQIKNMGEENFEAEFNVAFAGSSNTLIDAKKLAVLSMTTPLETDGSFAIWKHPIVLRQPSKSDIRLLEDFHHKYMMTVDTSHGKGMDYSTFLVFDITKIPFEVVARYRNNKIDPLVYPDLIYRVARYYHNALILVETNDIGKQIANTLAYDLEYEYVLTTRSNGRGGVIIGGGVSTLKTSLGVTTSKSVKRIGCLNLKTLIEKDKLIFYDNEILFELTRFIKEKASYQAEEGYHDDLAMNLVLFAWAVQEKYIKSETDVDIYKNLSQEHAATIEENLVPMGLYSNGIDDYETDLVIDLTDGQDFDRFMMGVF